MTVLLNQKMCANLLNKKEFHSPLESKILYVLASGFKDQNFLGNPVIPFLFKAVPKRERRNLALRLMGMSPHYFIYQWHDRYPSTMSRMEILEAEHQRNISSRKKICEEILRRYLNSQMIALDFGCGPGYLSREVAGYCKKVFGVDISCGIIRCAIELNNLDNIFYYKSNGKSLSMLDNSSVDLIYSFAVIQHLSEELFIGVLREFFRVLRPQGRVICHIALDDKPHRKLEKKKSSSILGYLQKRFGLRMFYRSIEDVRQKIRNAGFKEPLVRPIKEISNIEDDIRDQPIFIFVKP